MSGPRSVACAGLLSACFSSAALLSACQAFDSGKLEALLMPIETPPDKVDAGGGDGDAVVCVPAAEQCNEKDDDCDRKVDEQADEACMRPNAASVCATGGRCVIVSCQDGFENCNRVPDDGCEHDQSTGGCPAACGAMCEDAGSDAGDDAGPAPDDAAVDTPDAAVDASDDACVEMAEACNEEDDDCDGKVDETTACAIERCVATEPSYRGEACDRCVCEKCNQQRLNCQAHEDATWRTLCTDVVECYVVQDQMGACGTDHDCYASGACDGAIHLAAGGVDENDNFPAATGGCTPTNPPTTACQAVTNYRNECIDDLCATECAP